MKSRPVLHTPDGRYIIVRGRLWRATNPSLDAEKKAYFTSVLMLARRQLRGNKASELRKTAREAIHAAKVALGERGPVWWTDQAPDLNRHMVHLSKYAEWYATTTQQPALHTSKQRARTSV